MISLSTSQSQTNDTPSLLCIHLELVCGSQHPSLGDHSSKIISLGYIGGQEVMLSLSFTQPSFNIKGSGTEVPFGITSNFAFSFSVAATRSWAVGLIAMPISAAANTRATSSALVPETFKFRLRQNYFSCSGFHVWITSKGSSSRLISHLKLSHSM